MNYTDSDGYAVDAATGNRLHQSDQPVPTAVSDADMNQVIWELMEVLKAANIEGKKFDRTNAATYTQLRSALYALFAKADTTVPLRSTIIKATDLDALLVSGMYPYAHAVAANVHAPADGPGYGLMEVVNSNGQVLQRITTNTGSGSSVWVRSWSTTDQPGTWTRLSSAADSVRAAPSVAALRAISKASADKVQTLGYREGSTDGAGLYVQDKADNDSADNGGTVIVATDGARWKLVHNGSVSFKQFGARGNSSTAGGGTDDTAAIQAMLNTGLAITPDVTSVYRTDTPLVGKGQAVPAGMRFWYPKVSDTTGVIVAADPALDESGQLRIIYAEAEYALQAFVKMKALGFNTVLHYGYFGNYHWPAEGVGDVTKVLQGTKSAGLKVIAGGEAPNTTPASIVASWNAPHVLGFCVIDEPVARGISKVDQAAKIAAFKAVTAKPLITSEFGGGMVFDRSATIWGSPVQDNLADGYDIVLVNAYSRQYAPGTPLATKINNDLATFRENFGEMLAKSKARAIPAAAAFLMADGQAYSGDIQQVTAASKVFAKVGGDGSYAAFGWDMYSDAGISASMLATPALQQLASDLYAERASSARYKTEVYLFGSNSAGAWPIDGLATITANSSQAVAGVLVSAGVDGDFTRNRLPTGNVLLSGVMFKLAGQEWRTRMSSKGYITYKVSYADYQSGQPSTLRLIASNSGFTAPATEMAADAAISTGPYVSRSIAVPVGWSIGLRMTDTPDLTYYGKSLSGVLVNTNW